MILWHLPLRAVVRLGEFLLKMRWGNAVGANLVACYILGLEDGATRVEVPGDRNLPTHYPQEKGCLRPQGNGE